MNESQSNFRDEPGDSSANTGLIATGILVNEPESPSVSSSEQATPAASEKNAPQPVQYPSVYAYSNSRQFLRDWFRGRKQESRDISHRSVLRQMGVSSTGFLANVMSGKNNLTPSHVQALVRIMKMRKSEAQYFEALVHFTQDSSLDQKTRHLEKMESSRPPELKTLGPEQFKLFEEWHYPIIREWVSCVPCRDDYKEIAKRFSPRITPKQAEDGFKALERMGLIRRRQDGVWEQVDGIVTTGDEISSHLVKHFQAQTADKVRHVLETYPTSERDISVLTLGLSEETFKTICEEIRALRKRILKLASEEKNPQRVYQCAFQAFPVTQSGVEA